MSRRYDISKLRGFKELLDGDYKDEWVKPGFSLGTVGSLVSDNGIVKTMAALRMGLDIACGRGVDKGGVLYLSGDFSLEEISRFIRNIVNNPEIGCTEAEKEDFDKNFKLWDMEARKPSFDGFTAFADTIIAEAEKLSQRLRLIIFDSLFWLTPYCEDNTGDMNRIFASVERICEKTGASCLMLHETNDRESLLADYARYSEGIFAGEWSESKKKGCSKMERASRPDLARHFCWRIHKQNYAPDSNLEIWYRRGDDEVLVPVCASQNAAKNGNV